MRSRPVASREGPGAPGPSHPAAPAMAYPRGGSGVILGSLETERPRAMEHLDREEHLERVRRGDQEAARALIEELSPLVLRIVRSHLPRRAAEEDLAQEVFLKLFSRIDRYRPRRGVPFEHWVSRLAVRTCLDGLRAERRRPELRWSDLPGCEESWMEYLLSARAAPPDGSPEVARETLERLMRELPPEARLVIGLLDLEGRPVKEISAMTGWSSTLVKVRAFRARRRLRRIAEALEREMRHG
jgi:RNA polymerase sigma factor (sigma-70 family)